MNTFLALVDQQPTVWRALIYFAAALAAASTLASLLLLLEIFLGPLRVCLRIRPVRRPERRSVDTAPLFSGEPR